MTQYIIRRTGSLFGILHAIYLNFPGLFNEAKKHMAYRKKYKPYILKYKALILK